MAPLDYDTNNRSTVLFAALLGNIVCGAFDLLFLFALCALALAARF